MKSTALKLLKTLLSLLASIILFLAIVFIAFYFYLSDGVEFNIDQSNETISDLTEKFEIDFNKSSTIFLQANGKDIDTYITLLNPIVKKSDKVFLKSENITLNTTLDSKNILQFIFEIILKDNIDLNLVNTVNIKLKNPLIDISNFSQQDKKDQNNEKYFPVLVRLENGIMNDGDIEIGKFDLSLKLNQFLEYTILESYKFNLKSSEKFPLSYIAQFFPDIDSIGDQKESVSFNITLEDKSFNNSTNKQKLNGVIKVRNTKMQLRKFPAELKPEPIYSLNLDLNIKDNIAQANLTGSVYNPKKRWKYQSSNLQVGGKINFEEILKPNLDLIVNGYDIQFAKLENPNLNGLADLTVSIIGKNVLDLKGSLKIKKSSGFLVPLKDTDFQAKHIIRSLDEKE